MEKNVKTIKVILSVLMLILFAYLFKTLSFLFIPLSFGIFLTLIMLPAFKWLKKRKIPYFVTFILIILIFGLAIKGTSLIVRDTAKQIGEQSEKISQQFKKKLEPIITNSEQWFGINEALESDDFIKENIEGVLTSKGFGSFMKLSFGTAKKIMQGLFLTLFFFFLSLGAVLHYKEKIAQFSGDNSKYVTIFEELVNSLSVFLRVKTLISLATGVSFTIVAYIFKVDFPIFWGFFAFIINYIQMVGSIISTAVVVVFGYLQIDNLAGFALFAGLLAGAQVLFGSILEPILMGKSFSINTIFIVINLILWGYLWGISGMILSVPILVVIKIILDYSENYRKLGTLLGSRKQLIDNVIKKRPGRG